MFAQATIKSRYPFPSYFSIIYKSRKKAPTSFNLAFSSRIEKGRPTMCTLRVVHIGEQKSVRWRSFFDILRSRFYRERKRERARASIEDQNTFHSSCSRGTNRAIKGLYTPRGVSIVGSAKIRVPRYLFKVYVSLDALRTMHTKTAARLRGGEGAFPRVDSVVQLE